MPVENLSNGVIQEIFSERGNTFITVSYGRGRDGWRGDANERGQTGNMVDRNEQRDGASERGGQTGNMIERGRGRNEEIIRLVANRRTVILNTNGMPVPVSALRRGMTINAIFSAATTRSIPPQANAYLIQIVERAQREMTTTGSILEVNRNNRSFTIISERDFSTIIRFNTTENTRYVNRMGRRMEFRDLRPGLRVRVRHADFMTASIPPQTTAFEVEIL